MMKYPEDYINKIICGDCLEVMKDIPDKSIDLVLTDIPFNVNLKYSDYKDNLTDSAYKTNLEKWFGCMRRVSKIVVIKIPTINSPLVLDVFDKKLGYYWTIIQYSPNTTSHGRFNLNLYTQYIVSEYSKDDKVKRPNMDFFINTENIIETEHPAEMPVKPIRRLVDWFTNKNDIVLDCFLGSGTTALACEQLNRRWIGIEISPDYCKIAQKRIDQERSQLKFDLPEPKQIDIQDKLL